MPQCYRFSAVLLSITVFNMGSAFAAVYRCQQADGQIAYQDVPCSSGTQKKVDTPASGNTPEAAPAPAVDYPAQLSELDRRRNIREAIADSRPAVSMTRAELDKAMGTPDKINAAQYGVVHQDQLIYYRNGRTVYVNTQDGKVSSFQEEQGGGPIKRGKPCPSEHDMRKLEIDISSIRNRDNERLQIELRRQLREAKACQ